MECREIRELFFDHLEGSLSSIKKETVAKHLLSCRACGREYRILSEALAYLKNVPEETIPEGFYLGLEKKLDKAETPVFRKIAAFMSLPNTAVASFGVLAGLLLGFFLSNYLSGGSLIPGAHSVGKQYAAIPIVNDTGRTVIRAGNIKQAGYDIDSVLSRYEGGSSTLVVPKAPAELENQSSMNMSKKYIITVSAGQYEDVVKELNRMGYIMKLPGKAEMAEIKKLKPTDLVKFEMEITQ